MLKPFKGKIFFLILLEWSFKCFLPVDFSSPPAANKSVLFHKIRWPFWILASEIPHVTRVRIFNARLFIYTTHRNQYSAGRLINHCEEKSFRALEVLKAVINIREAIKSIQNERVYIRIIGLHTVRRSICHRLLITNSFYCVTYLGHKRPSVNPNCKQVGHAAQFFI